jgi:hypothetical protein
MTRRTLRAAFARATSRLVGKRCWAVIAGTGTGSDVALDFGDKVPRDHPVRNPHLTRTEQLHTGEFSLFVTCSWRLDSARGVICDWTDSNAAGGMMVRGLKKLVGRQVESVRILGPTCDLVLGFIGCSLHVSCVPTADGHENPAYDLTCWRCASRGRWSGIGYVVENGGRVRRSDPEMSDPSARPELRLCRVGELKRPQGKSVRVVNRRPK